MITVRRSGERGRSRETWLDSRHTFSFADYYDPGQMGFRTLRVINEDRVAPGTGFPLHPHRDMEILTFVFAGRLRHRDDLGHEEIIGAGDVQRITAGRGIRHSEDNPSASEEVHLLQVWILPERPGLEPGYEMRVFSGAEDDPLRLVVAPDGREGAIRIRQDVQVYAGRLDGGAEAEVSLAAGRHAWLQLVEGALACNGTRMSTGDGAAVSDEAVLRLAAGEETRFLLFDLN